MNRTTRYYDEIKKKVSTGTDKERRQAAKIASQQVELWSQDQSCPWDEDSASHSGYIEDWSENYHGEASLEYWLDLTE